MPRFDIVLLDADETVFDFKRAEAQSFKAILKMNGVEPLDEYAASYSEINLACWKALERGELTRERLKSLRFERFFHAIGRDDVDAVTVNEKYLNELAHSGYLLDGALEFVERLHEMCRIYIATNGLTTAQTGRMERSNLKPYIDGMYISEQIGHSKPDREFFEYIFDDLHITDLSRVVMLGDSLTSDMQGGRNAGIATCRYLGGAEPEPSPLCDWQIRTYDEFFDILNGG